MCDHSETGFGADSRAVSPAIGVVLLIGITVVLTAAAGTLVFGVVDTQGDALDGDADADFQVTFDAESVTVTHAGGDDVPADELRIDGDLDDAPATWAAYGQVSEGDSETFDADGENRTVYVVHVDQFGDETLLEVDDE